ncbi:hypothetical protein EDC01DRAFT_699259, partial [Geopyxis carbonaria]
MKPHIPPNTMADSTATSSSQCVIPPEMSLQSRRPLKDKSVLEHHDALKNQPLLPAVLPKHRVSPGFFRAFLLAMRIPFVSAADAGDDFSNNLFSDLAPILALFGEQVAKQYMSQSMGWLDDVIFACAPLGILTAIVGAIRVGGPPWMKAVIGRARESEGIVEVELMSSTSTDVCELWNGHGVIRVLGSSPVIELYYLKPVKKNTREAINLDPESGHEGPEIALMDQHAFKIYDFKSVRSQPPNWLECSSQNENTNPNVAPNIGLNLSGQRVSDLEMKVVAIIGVVLQSGVVVFAAVGVYLSGWNKNMKKDGKAVQGHAFPLMASGTLFLVIGMFLCCHIVEESTKETAWEIKPPPGYQLQVSWLQKGGEVNDQQFKSYILPRNNQRFNSGGVLGRWLERRSPDVIRTSQKKYIGKTSKAVLRKTIIAVTISLVGFVAQFVGLRGLAWPVTISQLIAIGIMTILRARIRRSLVHAPDDVKTIASGYELEAMAKKATDCGHWSITKWEPTSRDIMEPTQETTIDTELYSKLARNVVESRKHLGLLSQWPSQFQKTIDSLTEAIEAAIEFLWGNDHVKLIAGHPSNEFNWKLSVKVSTSRNPERVGPTSIEMRVSRKILPGGVWGSWKTSKSEIEAVLGLWMLHFEKPALDSGMQTPGLESSGNEDELAGENSGIHRIVAYEDTSGTLIKKWILPQTQLRTTKTPTGNETGDVIAIFRELATNPEDISVATPPHMLQSMALDSSSGRHETSSSCLAVLSETPLEQICAQHIFSSFLFNAADQVESISGDVLGRGGEQFLKASFGRRNTALDELVDTIVRTGLANTEDALLSIIPALVEKLPTISSVTSNAFSHFAKEISTYIEGGRFEQSESLLLWLLDTAEFEARQCEKKQEWNNACKTYCLLYKTYNEIGSFDYACRAKKAIGLFCERLFLSAHKSGPHSGELISLANMVFREMKINNEDIDAKWQEELKERERARRTSQPSEFEGEELVCQIAANGDYLKLLASVAEPTVVHVNLDRRTPLILSSISGEATKAAQLLSENANPLLKDRYGRTALHYAAKINDTSVLHTLLLHEKINTVIDELDNNGKSPLDIAIQNNAGAAVTFLIFYGAKDPEGKAMELVEISVRQGSYAAIKTLPNVY